MNNGLIVVLTGAGISAESGIRTFRGADGLWENHRIEDVASIEGFIRNPSLVQQFYNGRRRQLLSEDIEPNPAHIALGRLEKEYPGKARVITQNIDNLHERGGSVKPIHMHGELLKMYCEFCSVKFDISGDLDTGDICGYCGKSGGLRPDIIWFGEMPYHLDEIQSLLSGCELFVAVGTSGNVYPAAGFVQAARRAGAFTMEINLEPSQVNEDFDVRRYGPAGTLVPTLVDEILAGEVLT